MATDGVNRLGATATVAVVLVGVVLVLMGFLLSTNGTLFTVLVAVGAATIASAVVSVLSRMIPDPHQRVKLLESHEEVYDEFRRIVGELDPTRPHTIRTINSFIAKSDVEEEWDEFLVDYLSRNKSSQLIRVLAYRDTQEWRERIDRLRARYGETSNYRQIRWERPSMPTIEMFLVDSDDVVLSFGVEDVANPKVDAGIRIRDRDFCERLEAYHRIQLEQKFPRDDFRQLLLDQQ